MKFDYSSGICWEHSPESITIIHQDGNYYCKKYAIIDNELIAGDFDWSSESTNKCNNECTNECNNESTNEWERMHDYEFVSFLSNFKNVHIGYNYGITYVSDYTYQIEDKLFNHGLMIRNEKLSISRDCKMIEKIHSKSATSFVNGNDYDIYDLEFNGDLISEFELRRPTIWQNETMHLRVTDKITFIKPIEHEIPKGRYAILAREFKIHDCFNIDIPDSTSDYSVLCDGYESADDKKDHIYGGFIAKSGSYKIIFNAPDFIKVYKNSKRYIIIDPRNHNCINYCHINPVDDADEILEIISDIKNK
jgi:hypothetical protein